MKTVLFVACATSAIVAHQTGSGFALGCATGFGFFLFITLLTEETM